MMKQLSCFVLLAAAVGGFCSWSSAAITEGDPWDANSWVQRFQQSWTEYGGHLTNRPFDLIAVKMVSPNDYFQRPVFQNFSVAGWQSHTPAAPWPTMLVISAAQTATWSTLLQMDMVFAGDKTNELIFDVAVYARDGNNGYSEIETPVQTQRFWWNCQPEPGNWGQMSSYDKWRWSSVGVWAPTRTELLGMMSPDGQGGMAPEPGSIAIWTLLGVAAAGVWYRRRRAAA